MGDDADRQMRDRALHVAVLGGDEKAWRTWYDASYASLQAYVSWRCGGLRQLTEDVIQETWLTAIRRIADYRPSAAPFLAWLRGIAALVVSNQLRRERRRQYASLDSQGQVICPADEMSKWQEAEAVARALASLPPRYEAALRAKYLEGLSVAEIASDSGESEKAIESLLTRARAAFRAAYELVETDHVR